MTIKGNLSGNHTYTDETVIVTGRLTGGTITLNNSTLIIEGGSKTNPSASSSATVVMQSGVNTLDLAHISTSASSNLTIKGLAEGDNVGIGGATFTSTHFTSTSGVFGTTGVMDFAGAGNINVTLADVFNRNFYSDYATVTVKGTQYEVATLDPGTSSTGGKGGTPITQNNLLGKSDTFLQGGGSSGTTDPQGQGTPQGPTGIDTGGNSLLAGLSKLLAGLSKTLGSSVTSDLLKVAGASGPTNGNNNNQGGAPNQDNTNHGSGTIVNPDPSTIKNLLPPTDHH